MSKQELDLSAAYFKIEDITIRERILRLLEVLGGVDTSSDALLALNLAAEQQLNTAFRGDKRRHGNKPASVWFEQRTALGISCDCYPGLAWSTIP